MYIVQQSFTSVHGRYYYRGQEVSWLWRQLMHSEDKKKLVKRSAYISAYEEDYRQEVQERDGEEGIFTLYDKFGNSPLAPVQEEWAPHEDFGSAPYRGFHPLEREGPITDPSEDEDYQAPLGGFSIDGLSSDSDPILDTTPVADWNNDLPQNNAEDVAPIHYDEI